MRAHNDELRQVLAASRLPSLGPRLRVRGVFIAFRQQIENSIGNVKRGYRILKYHLDSRGERSFTFITRLACSLYNHRLTIRKSTMREVEWYAERVEKLYQ